MDELKRWRRDLVLICYHVISTIVLGVLYLNGSFNSGPCNPGLGLVLFMLAGLIIVGLVLKGIYFIIRNRANKYFLIINLFALVVWLAVFFNS